MSFEEYIIQEKGEVFYRDSIIDKNKLNSNMPLEEWFKDLYTEYDILHGGLKVVNMSRSVLLDVEWKVTLCHTGEDCWCRMIEPVEPVTDDKGDEWDSVVGAAQIGEDLAEHIVELHNQYVREQELYKPNPSLKAAAQTYRDHMDEYLGDRLGKYMDIPTHINEEAQPRKHSEGVEISQEVWDRTLKMGLDRISKGEEPCCDENNPCGCMTFSPNVPKPGDWEKERKLFEDYQNDRNAMWRRIIEKLRIPKKYFGRG